jgi:hypothetical protein
VDIRTCSINSACAYAIYKKNVWGCELHGNDVCYYRDRDRVCSDGAPSNFTRSDHRKASPCTLFVCNGSYTSVPLLTPTALPTFPLTSTPSFRPIVSLEPSRSVTPTAQVRWVLGLQDRSCATTCAAVRGDCLPYHSRRILELSISCVTCCVRSAEHVKGEKRILQSRSRPCKRSYLRR